MRDCAGDCNNCGHMQLQMSAIDMTKNIFFERLYLVQRISTFGPFVNCPMHPQFRLFSVQLFLYFGAIFFPELPCYVPGIRVIGSLLISKLVLSKVLNQKQKQIVNSCCASWKAMIRKHRSKQPCTPFAWTAHTVGWVAARGA